MRRNVPQNTQKITPQQEPPASSDAEILSFDNSCSANDERRRAIVSDVEDIDKSCAKITEFSKLEQNLCGQVHKDLSHASNENTALLRGVSEMLDSLSMSNQVRLGLEQTLKQQLASKLNPQDPDGIIFHNTPTSVQQGADKENSNTNHVTSIHSIRKNHRSKSGQVDDLARSWKEGSRVLDIVTTEKRAVEGQVTAARARMESDRSWDRLVQEKENTKTHQKTLDAVREQNKATKSSLEDDKERNRQIVAEGRTIMDAFESKSKAQALEEAQLDKLLVGAQDKQQRETKLLAALEADLASLSLQNDNLNKQLEVVESVRRTREQKKRQLEDTRIERTVLFASKTALGAKFTAVKANCDCFTRAILEQKEIQVKIEEVKATNDKVEFEELERGRAEFDDLSKVKEKLSSLITSVKQKDQDMSKTLETDMKTLASLEEEQATISKDVEEKLSILHSQERLLVEHKSEFSKDYEGEMALVKEYKDKTQFEYERCKDVEKHLELERKAEVLRLAVQILEHYSEQVKQYA